VKLNEENEEENSSVHKICEREKEKRSGRKKKRRRGKM